MKLQGIFGKGSGKVGSSVFAVSGGEQIVREYNPKVSNPQTDAQIEQRAKLKLLSQLAAAMAGQLAFRKEGLVSPRNKFIQANMPFVTYANDKAEINLINIKITNGSTDLPALSLAGATAGTLQAQLTEAAPADVTRVKYVVYGVNENDKLSFAAEELVTTAGTGRTFPASFDLESGKSYVVLAYGIKNESTKASTKFDNYSANDGSMTAWVEILRSLSVNDYALTATIGEMADVE